VATQNPYESPRRGLPRQQIRYFPLLIRERRRLKFANSHDQLDTVIRQWGARQGYLVESRGSTAWTLKRNFGFFELVRATFSWDVRRLPVAISLHVSVVNPERGRLLLVCRFPLAVATAGDPIRLTRELDDLEEHL
jgi:hypothetical protein